jgi:H+/Cl- antiporter ClcA
MFGRERGFERRESAVSPALLLAAALVGLAAGGVSAAYLLVIHLLQYVLAPDNFGAVAQFGVLAVVGAAVFALGRVLGSPGDVELLVDNIHVSGGGPRVRSLRSLIPASWLTIAAGGAAGPEAPLVTTCGVLAS